MFFNQIYILLAVSSFNLFFKNIMKELIKNLQDIIIAITKICPFNQAHGTEMSIHIKYLISILLIIYNFPIHTQSPYWYCCVY